jgi:hypothetical protein
MNNIDDQGRDALDDAAARVAEIAELYLSVRNLLRQMIAEIETATATLPKAIVTKLSDLQSAHLKVLAAEEAFHAQQQASQPDAAIDYDALRDDIGGQLDRIRAALDAD